MKKNIFLIVAGVVAILIVGVVIVLNMTREEYRGLPVKYFAVTSAYDLSTPEKLVGISKYVTIIKAGEIIDYDYFDITDDDYQILTNFNVRVIQNLKGELASDKDIVVSLSGGLTKDGKSYELLEEIKLFEEDNYYLVFMYISDLNNELCISNEARVIDLGTDINTSENTEIINKYKDAIINEELPPQDMLKLDKTQFFLNTMSKYDVNY